MSNPEHPYSAPMSPAKKNYSGGPQTSGLAITSLVLGGVSILFSCLTGIPGIICGIMALNQIGKSNGRVTGKGMAITGVILSSVFSMLAIIGILIGMLLPAVQQVRTAARRTATMNSLRQIQLAQLNYDNVYRHLPGYGLNSDQPGSGLSWRVHILPFLGEQQLFDQFDMNEPWDGPNNKKLIEMMPEVYLTMGGAENYRPGYTTMLRPIGNGAFPDPAAEDFQTVNLSMITDGSSNTIAVVDADLANAVIWTKPDDDYYFDPNDPSAGLTGNWQNGVLCVKIDGSTEYVPGYSSSPAQIKSMMTHAAND